MFKRFKKKTELSEQEFRLIYDLFYERVFRDAFFVIKDQHLAQDVVQDTFVKAFKYMDRLENREKMGAWLSTIATRTAIDLIRKQSSWNGVPTEDFVLDHVKSKQEVSASLETTVENKLRQEAIIDKIAMLKPEYREVLVLKYIHELKDKEISAFTDLKEGTIKSRIHRAKKELRMQMEADESCKHLFGGET
ncbi:ECF RNA polymerase sigma factor SigW [Paraliobacillus sp. PM-2]|uniref:RNA polymerase sigma factor n=1 Tax=Paraliobacillus sp. PM-2 TaxID=1462524 RepID=UPI00061BFBF1|nr:RNA polymerase sigma factor [Paraliobacillus sp. PM-2]CQR48399.1 ECF RNA polymerase sigma factor SigW [Paraliobacillus sp. PM-2]